MMTVVLGRMGLQPNRMERDGTSHHYPMIYVSLATCVCHTSLRVAIRMLLRDLSPIDYVRD